MNTTSEIIAASSQITVVNDGQFQYPVMTKNLSLWIDSNGEITASNYDKFCSEVECVGEKAAGTVGSAGMIALCESLIDAGSEYVRLA